MGLTALSVKGENNELLIVEYWVTGAGDEIPITWLSDSHLDNILRFQQKMALTAIIEGQKDLTISSYAPLTKERERRRKCRQDHD